jgi:hypothetical protein
MERASNLDRRIHQGYYGEAFVQVLAASAGLVVSRPGLDVTGEDFMIGHPGRQGTLRHPKIEVQVKSWSKPTGTDTVWRYRMRASHYNELADCHLYLPRYLFLVIVPSDADRYTSVADDALRLHHAGYWASFAGRSTVTSAQTVTVDVPRRNLLTTASLRSLIPSGFAAVPAPRSRP